MPPIITYSLIIFLGLFVVLIIIELIFFHAVKKFIVQVTILFGVIAVLRLAAGFPVTRVAFGGNIAPIIAIGIMFICTLLGMASHYFYYMRGKFAWRTFFKTMVVAPIVFLPLIGSVQATSGLESIQMISFGIIAFQNGFFWKQVFDHAKSKI